MFFDSIDSSSVPALRQSLRRLKPGRLAKAMARDRASDPAMASLLGNLPPAKFQEQFTGLSGARTFRQALTFLDVGRSEAVKMGQSFESESATVLDFGCGWGRVTQLLSLYFSPDRIIGADVMGDALAMCRNNGVPAQFLQTQPWPPCSLADSSVDRIFAYSVFSHLSEENANAWIQEFVRVLAPKGMVFLTTRHRSFFDHVERMRRSSGPVADFARGANAAFIPYADYVRRYEAGQFCFDAMGAGGPGLTAVYGEAAIPPGYVRSVWGKSFSSATYRDPVPDGLLDQATIVLTK